MQTKPKSNSVVTHALRPDGVIVFNVVGAGPITFDYRAKVHANNRARAEVHGWCQRIVDAAAIPRDTTTGRSATPADKHAAMQRLVTFYESGTGDWRANTASGGPRKSTLDALALAAVAEATGRAPDEVRDMIERGAAAKSVSREVYLATLATSSRVAPIIERMRAAGLGEITGDDLLAEAMEGAQPE